jgi:hypothetical protein
LHGHLTENETLNALVSSPDPATGMEQEAVNYSYQSIETLFMGPSGSALDSWQEQLQTQSGGTGGGAGKGLTEGNPGQPLLASWFAQQDLVTATLTQASPSTVPPPVSQINAVFQTWGDATVSMLRAATVFTPELDTGTVQYTDSGLQTIIMPDGSMQEVTQTAQDSGTFIIAVLVG